MTDYVTNPTTMRLHQPGPGIEVAALIKGDGIDLVMGGRTHQLTVAEARAIANAMLASATESERDA